MISQMSNLIYEWWGEATSDWVEESCSARIKWQSAAHLGAANSPYCRPTLQRNNSKQKPARHLVHASLLLRFVGAQALSHTTADPLTHHWPLWCSRKVILLQYHEKILIIRQQCDHTTEQWDQRRIKLSHSFHSLSCWLHLSHSLFSKSGLWKKIRNFVSSRFLSKLKIFELLNQCPSIMMHCLLANTR